MDGKQTNNVDRLKLLTFKGLRKLRDYFQHGKTDSVFYRGKSGGGWFRGMKSRPPPPLPPVR